MTNEEVPVERRKFTGFSKLNQAGLGIKNSLSSWCVLSTSRVLLVSITMILQSPKAFFFKSQSGTLPPPVARIKRRSKFP